MKQSTTMRLSDLTKSQIDELSGRFKMTMTDVVATAVDRFYQQETSQMQYTIFRYSDNTASVINEAAFQAAIAGTRKDKRGVPLKHDYPGKPRRSDYTVWRGDADDILEEYLQRAK